eukprot:scaffold49_cov180-Ochromonas_danica.AAC.5
MSGRLVILPHKSWNVWNQDNRERVLRDERLHREEEEHKAIQAQERARQQNLETLRSSVLLDNDIEGSGGSHKRHPSSPSSSSPLTSQSVPISVSVSQPVSRHYHENEEFMKELAEHEARRKRREGIQDWALGEGCHNKQWYNLPPRPLEEESRGTNNNNKREGKRRNREEEEDPMAKFLSHSYDIIESKTDENMEEVEVITHSTDKRRRLSYDDEDNRGGEEEGEREEEEEKGDGHREEDGERKKRRKKEKKVKHIKQERDHHHHRHSSSRASSSQSMTSSSMDVREVLRQKRLEREKAERVRESCLLVEHDVYGSYQQDRGSSGSVGGGGYYQQYFPHLSRRK